MQLYNKNKGAEKESLCRHVIHASLHSSYHFEGNPEAKLLDAHKDGRLISVVLHFHCYGKVL